LAARFVSLRGVASPRSKTLTASRGSHDARFPLLLQGGEARRQDPPGRVARKTASWKDGCRGGGFAASREAGSNAHRDVFDPIMRSRTGTIQRSRSSNCQGAIGYHVTVARLVSGRDAGEITNVVQARRPAGILTARQRLVTRSRCGSVWPHQAGIAGFAGESEMRNAFRNDNPQ